MTGTDGVPPARSTRKPAYLIIERYLWGLLSEGGGISGPLPGEVQLAQQFGVSVMTVRQGYSQLVNAGAVVRMRSQGTFAVPHLTEDLGRMTGRSYPDTWRQQVSDLTWEVLQFTKREAPVRVARSFGCKPGSLLAYLERLRSANKQPVAWDTRWMPLSIVENVDRDSFEKDSVFGVMSEAGLEFSTMQSDISARTADPIHAKVLECPVNSALLVRTLSCTDAQGKALLMGISLYPAARFSFRSTTRLTELHVGKPSPGAAFAD